MPRASISTARKSPGSSPWRAATLLVVTLRICRMVQNVGTYAQEPTVCKTGSLRLGASPCPHYLGQHLHNVRLDAADVTLNLFERTRWGVTVEVAVKVDFVADDP